MRATTQEAPTYLQGSKSAGPSLIFEPTNTKGYLQKGHSKKIEGCFFIREEEGVYRRPISIRFLLVWSLLCTMRQTSIGLDDGISLYHKDLAQASGW